MDREEIILDAALLCNMSIGKIFRDSEEQIRGIEFSDDGNMLAAFNESTLNIYDVQIAKKIKTLHNKLSKISQLRFTHSNTAVVFTGEIAPFDLYYWSIYENEIVKIFKGSEECPNKSIFLNPVNDLVLAYDKGNFLRIYCLDSMRSDPAMTMNFGDQIKSMAANFDRSGCNIVVAVTYNDQNEDTVSKIEFHNIKEKYNGRRLVTYLEDVSPVQLIKHDNEGRLMACLLQNGSFVLVSVVDGQIVKTIPNAMTHKNIIPEFDFSPDSRFILTGSEEGQVKIFEVETGNEIAKYTGHIKPCACIKFSPVFVMFASACQNVIFWIPKYWDNAYN
jgi:COMPASS component SWD2